MPLSRRCVRAAALIALVSAAFPVTAAANHSAVERLPDAGNHLGLGGLSADGGHVYLESIAPLLPEDTNSVYDVYGLHAGTLTLVTVPQEPLGSSRQNDASFGGAAADGSRVWFGSRDPFVESDVNGGFDAYERFDGVTRLLTTGPGRPERTTSFYEAHAYSADGTRFIFGTRDPLVPEDAHLSSRDIYERVGDTTRLLSGWGGADEDASLGFESASKDARTVVFWTRQPLVPEDTNDIADRYAAIDGVLHVIAPPVGEPGGFGYFVQASDDGSKVFFSSGHQVTPDDTDASIDTYVWSPDEGIRLLSIGPVGGNGNHHVRTSAVSPDGTRVFFQTAEQLTADDTDAVADLYEFSDGSAKLVSSGPSATGFSGISGDSRHLFFLTDDRLTVDDIDDGTDLYEQTGGGIRLISTGPTDPHDTANAWYEASSFDGSRVFFAARGRLTAQDRNDAIDLYERFGATTTLITSGAPGRLSFPFDYLHLTVSPDGTRVYYQTQERVLPSDTDDLWDVYVVSVATPYVHPRGATPLRASLVPAFRACASPNATHGEPLAFPACKPPVAESAAVVMGRSGIGSARLSVRTGDPATAEDEADVAIQVAVTDVQTPAGADYAGELALDLGTRLTDRATGEVGGESGTVQDMHLRMPFACAPTASDAVGSECDLITSADAAVPGLAVEGRRALLSLDGVVVDDAQGARFLRQGVFIP